MAETEHVAPGKAEGAEVAESGAGPDADSTAAAVGRGALFVLALILLSLLWYLLSDRFTPYTDQARVQGYVVGVAPEVAGVVTQMWVSNNQPVAAGDPLFQIDPSQYEIALVKAKSDLESARRQVDAGSAVVESARASLRAAQANLVKAEKDTNRLERLRREDAGTISMRRLEISRASLDQARAGVAAADADVRRAIDQMGGDDNADNAILKAAQSAVSKAELDLAHTLVRATSRGVIADLRAEVGRFAGTGNPVLTLISLQDVWIEANFTENNLGNMRAGSTVEILFDVLPGRIFKGEVRSVGAGISSGQAPPPGTLPTVQNNRDWLRQAQRFPVVIGFPVSEGSDLYPQLRIGGQASVIAYSDGHPILELLGRLYIRVMSYFAYAY